MERMVAQIVEIVKRKYAKELIDKDNLKDVEKVFKKVSDELTANSLKRYLEEYDEKLQLDNKRNKNYVVQRAVSKSITSVLGTFRLNRTRYYDKENDRYFCLLDRKLNIPEYEHMTPLAMARMLDIVTNSSYRIAGKEINSRDEFSKGMYIINLRE